MQRTIELSSILARGLLGTTASAVAAKNEIAELILPFYETPFAEGVTYVLGTLVGFLTVVSFIVTIYNSLKWSGKERRHRDDSLK